MEGMTTAPSLEGCWGAAGATGVSSLLPYYVVLEDGKSDILRPSAVL